MTLEGWLATSVSLVTLALGVTAWLSSRSKDQREEERQHRAERREDIRLSLEPVQVTLDDHERRIARLETHEYPPNAPA